MAVSGNLIEQSDENVHGPVGTFSRDSPASKHGDGVARQPESALAASWV